MDLFKSVLMVLLVFADALVAYRKGNSTGVMVGTGCGIFMTLVTGDIAYMGMLCLMGVLVSVFRVLGRGVCMIAYLAAILIVGILYAPEALYNAAWAIVAGSLIFAFLPKHYVGYPEKKQKRAEKEEPIATQRANVYGLLLEQKKAVFEDLGKEFAHMPEGETFSQMARQYDEVYRLVAAKPGISEKTESKLKDMLYMKKIKLQKLIWQPVDNHQEAFVTVSADEGCIKSEALSQVFEEVFKGNWQTSEDSAKLVSEKSCMIKLEEKPVYTLLYGVSGCAKHRETISGDNFGCLAFPEGKALTVLCDGTGTGPKACKESGKAIDQLEKLLEAGYHLEAAVRLIHESMLKLNTPDTGTTLDACLIDLYTGDAQFIKAGAAATFIKKGRKIEVFYGESMPLGIFEECNLNTCRRKLVPGEYLIMVTDGVVDDMPGIMKEDSMSEFLAKLDNVSPHEMAKRILKATGHTEEQTRDDRTVLVAALTRKDEED